METMEALQTPAIEIKLAKQGVLSRLWNTRRVLWESVPEHYVSGMEEERQSRLTLYWERGLHLADISF